jgi:hypothetical protein
MSDFLTHVCPPGFQGENQWNRQLLQTINEAFGLRGLAAPLYTLKGYKQNSLRNCKVSSDSKYDLV